MPLSDIRSRFLTATGDYSLKRGDQYDSIINDAQKLLDGIRLRIHRKQETIKQIVAGDIYTTILYYLAISDVWLANSEGRYHLDQKHIEWLRDQYGTPTSELTQSTPLYWALGNIDLTAESYDLESAFSGFYDVETILFAEDDGSGGADAQTFNKARIIFMPPADGTYTIHIEGQFMQPPLSAATDVSLWTERYPTLLIQAAKYIYEAQYMDNYTRAREIREDLEYQLMNMIDKPQAMQASNKLRTMRRTDFRAY